MARIQNWGGGSWGRDVGARTAGWSWPSFFDYIQHGFSRARALGRKIFLPKQGTATFSQRPNQILIFGKCDVFLNIARNVFVFFFCPSISVFVGSLSDSAGFDFPPAKGEVRPCVASKV